MKVRIGLNVVQFSLSPYNISIIQTKPFIFRQRSLLIKCVSRKRLEITMSIIKGHNRFIPCSLLSDCKNVQKSALKSVNVQRTGKSILQMFAFSFFDGNHICRFLPILRPPTVPRSHFRYPKTKVFILIISYLYLQIATSASESRFCVGK